MAEGAPVEIEEQQKGRVEVWLDGAIIFWLFLFAIFAPHSIALTQMAWGGALLTFGARFLLRPRPRIKRSPIDYALLGFLALTLVSSFLSYDPGVSIGKLRAVSLFTIIYLVAWNVTSKRVLRLLALALVASCVVNVFYTFGERIVGRGVKVEGIKAESPLRAAVFVNAEGEAHPGPVKDGDTLLEVDGKPLLRPEELVAALEDRSGGTEPALLKVYSVEWVGVVRVPRGRLLDGATPLERLGVAGWSRGRDWRATGFYGHYVTYAEVLQLIASLALGLFVALREKRSLSGVLLFVAFAGMCGALLLTVTRASWLALLVSAFVIALVGLSRRAVLITAGVALPVVITGLFILQEKRRVGFVDQKDQSVVWRETVWREGLNLLARSPRHLLVGVGMDSIKNHWREWGLFDEGRIPVGHMHNTYLQLALERGVPALLLWVTFIFIYARMLWRLARSERFGGWIERGVVLGALGGLLGFLTSGMFEYNLGDSEVVMVFYFIMGLSLVIERGARNEIKTGGA
ncbi:MAG: O-antigen ligase family protein [Acidobacteriota bacterium]|nr:O-antigen ligase family protein [Acidobacteriota bacterium]